MDPILEKYVQIINEDDESTMTVGGNGTKIWRNKKGQLHRTDGPAVIWPSGSQEYYINGKCHREDGPAVIYSDGRVEYYINGKWLSEDQFYEYIIKKAIKMGEKK